MIPPPEHTADSSVPWYEAAFRGEYLSLYTHRSDAEAAQLADLIARTTGLGPGTRVADVPCGAGRHLRGFHPRGWVPLGMDLSFDLLRSAQQQGAGSGVCRGDIRAVPFASQQFDLVVNLFTSLGYFDQEQENRHALSELVRLMRHSGWLVVDFLNANWVRRHLKTASERTTPEGWRVEERREIVEARTDLGQAVPRVVKSVWIHKPGEQEQPRPYVERVALLDRAWFQTELERHRLQWVAAWGDYQGLLSPDDPEASRLIIFARS